MSDVEEVAKLLIQAVKVQSPATGADLGPLVKQHHPTFDLKNEYGGLHKFINRYCREEIAFLGKRGLDNVYAHRNSEHKSSLSYNSSGSHNSNVDAWRAFTNPKIHLIPLVDIRSGDIDVALPSQPELKEGWIPIEKISAEEYRLMAQDFVATLPSSEAKNQLQDALTIQDFWPTWSLMVNRHRVGGIFDQWVAFRIAQIREIFTERLSQLNLSEAVFNKALHSFRASRGQVARQKPPQESYKKESAGPRSTPGVRNVILQAVSDLTDEDLRRIWLPAGVLIDALKGNRGGR
ncbi:MAG TPA: hypothetical protein VFS76_07120 [Pyrinomonadaceae bacterium]|nr:hypothetical protein [Pyrinomonadaceae bacterium]